jgi:small subunit ribosomal protein S2
LATAYWLLAREVLIQKGQLKEGESLKYGIDDFETKIVEEEVEEEPVRTPRFERSKRQ